MLCVPFVANKRSAVEPPIQKSRLWQTSEAQLSHRSKKGGSVSLRSLAASDKLCALKERGRL